MRTSAAGSLYSIGIASAGELPGGVDQKLEPPRLHRIEACARGYGEKARVAVRLQPLGSAGKQPLIVVMDEADGAVALDDADAVEAVTVGLPEMAGAVKIVRPVRSHEDHVGALRNAIAEVFETTHAEHVGADRRRRHQAEEDLAVEIVRLAERHVEDRIGPARLRERGGDVSRGEAPVRRRTIGDKLVPRFQDKGVDIEGRLGDGAPPDAGRQHQPRGIVDARAHQARRDRRLGDEVRPHRIRTAAERHPGLVREESVELRLPYRVVVDIGLAVKHHLGAGDVAVRLDAGDHVVGDRRVSDRGDDVERGKDVGHHLVAFVDGDGGGRALLWPQPLGAGGIDHRHHVGGEPLAQLALFRQRRRDEREQRQQKREAAGIERPGDHSRTCFGFRSSPPVSARPRSLSRSRMQWNRRLRRRLRRAPSSTMPRPSRTRRV
jgi:hypothetical protein